MQLQGVECALFQKILIFFLYTVFKYCWIFIHVAEAGLPCSPIRKVFHLPSPSCTSDNLQYYFFCLTEFVSIAV